ncbi:MAG TPA: hypothetical protein VJ927_04320 [Actinomycetota bacterium]|nr:hypothetical protein [Actinomycetota bacterium]
MDQAAVDLDVRRVFRDWLFDLHRSGRVLSTQTQRDVEHIASLVIAGGGSLQEAFSAARNILPQPTWGAPA